MSTTKRDYNTLHSYASKAYKITKSSDQIRDWSKDTWNALKRLKVKNDMNNFERKFDEEIGKLNAILTEQQEQKKKKMERSTISRFLISKPNNKKIAKPIKKDKQEMDGSDDEKDDHKDNVSNTNNARAQQTKKVRRFSELSPQPQSHAPPEKKQKIMQTPQKKHQTPAIDRLKSKIGICMKSFANKTQKENHRKACHRGNVGTQIEDEDLELDEVPMYDVIGDEALKIIGKRNGLYLVQYADSTEWAQLSDECPLVKDFKED
eukprot:152779_1